MRATLQENEWDLVTSDYNMPKFSAPEALDVLKESEKDIPFIVVSGAIGEEVAVWVSAFLLAEQFGLARRWVLT